MSVILWIANDPVHFGLFCWAAGFALGWIVGRPNPYKWMRIPETSASGTTYKIDIHQ